jgi:hypothetical protein
MNMTDRTARSQTHLIAVLSITASITRKRSGLDDGYPVLVTLMVITLVILRSQSVSLSLWKNPVF